MNKIMLNKHNIESSDFINLTDNIKASGKYLLGVAAADERSLNSKYAV